MFPNSITSPFKTSFEIFIFFDFESFLFFSIFVLSDIFSKNERFDLASCPVIASTLLTPDATEF